MTPTGPLGPEPETEVKKMDIRKATLLLLSTSLVVACGSDPKPPPAAPAGTIQAPMATAPPASSAKPDDDASKGQINISDEIKRACGITDAEAYFDFDSAHVQDNARAVLTKLAKCFTDGPLKGRKMNLVGHADPRGEEEYNMVLGGKRADNVKHFLVGVGLPDAQAMTTSRGEMDATGTEEASWAKDRRVDVVLAS
jgi:peptidoglycan-associated lipoprotein